LLPPLLLMEESLTHSTEARQPLLSIVTPVFREGAHLPAFLAGVRSSLEQCHLSYELVLVDDGSPDDTWRVIIGEAKSCQALRALRLSRNFGKESALCAGLEHARGDAVIVIDADGQHPPSLIPEMVRLWQNSGADIVEAVKRRRGRESLSSKFGAQLFYFILNKLSGFHFKGASDFKLMNRKAVDAWLKMDERNVFFRGMTVWMGFTTVQMPFEVVPRSAGQSTWSVLKRLKLALIGITAFSSFPLHLVTFAGMVFLGLSVLLGLETLYLKLAGRAVSGFATVILLELIIGSLLMISLGIIGEYLARIYEEVKGRPRYLVKESIEPDSL
ncbi:MAG TPA: glycosyltransferase family 2 protein, partial [Nitrososphaera sp.]|nr:glycosyltransferase family 2 protein [Nitrososphaera sp.]